jgi:hypothetical protein
MDFWTLLTSVIGSFAGAWLAAHFALKRFYKEKVWERKTAAYTAIFEALHDMSTWFEEHFNAMVSHREVPEERQSELTVAYQVATKTFQRRLAAETWLIPDEIRKRLDDMEYALDQLDNLHDFSKIVVDGDKIIFAGTNELREMVRKDLLLQPNWFARKYSSWPRRTVP